MSQVTDLPLTLADGTLRLGKATLSSDVPSRAQLSSLSMDDLPPLEDPVLATMSLPADFMSTRRAPLQRRRGQFRRNSDPLVLEKSDARHRVATCTFGATVLEVWRFLKQGSV